MLPTRAETDWGIFHEVYVSYRCEVEMVILQPLVLYPSAVIGSTQRFETNILDQLLALTMDVSIISRMVCSDGFPHKIA